MIDRQYIKENVLDSIGRLKYTKVKLMEIPEDYLWCFSKEEYLHSIWFNNTEPPKCLNCDARLKYVGPFNKGYHKTCSKSCAGFIQLNRGVPDQEKLKKTCLEKYGVENPFQYDIFKEKSKSTKLEKYNDENYNNRDKAKETSLYKYGTERPSQSDEVKAKIRRNNKNDNPDVIQKKKETTFKNHGVDVGFKLLSKEQIVDRGFATAKGLKRFYQTGNSKFRFLYVMSSNDLGLIKIGISKNVDMRLKFIQKKVPDATLILSKYFVNSGDIESYLQNYHDKCNVVLERGINGRTEWFDESIRAELVSQINNILKI